MMKRMLFGIVTLIVGILLQFIANKYLTFWGVSPNILLMATVTLGFVRSPMTAQTLGFFWGLVMDSMGVSMFGSQSLLLAAAGYISGKLRRRVRCDIPGTQMVIGFVATVLYALSVFGIHYLFEEGIKRSFISIVLMGSILNVLMIPAVFWCIEHWISLWNLRRERN